MFKELVTSKNFVSSDNEKGIIKYFITKSLDDDTTIYGVCVESFICNGRNEIPDDDEQVLKLSYSYNQVLKVIKTLANNLVTPTSLYDVIDEIL